MTDPRALLRACQVASGLTVPRYATERLARSPRCVFYWLRGERPIPPRMVAFLERSPEYPKALELLNVTPLTFTALPPDATSTSAGNIAIAPTEVPKP